VAWSSSTAVVEASVLGVVGDEGEVVVASVEALEAFFLLRAIATDDDDKRAEQSSQGGEQGGWYYDCCC
jgi:hypothetical protein